METIPETIPETIMENETVEHLQTILDDAVKSILETIPEVVPVVPEVSILDTTLSNISNSLQPSISEIQAAVEPVVESVTETKTICETVKEIVTSILTVKTELLIEYTKSILGSGQITPLNFIMIVNSLMKEIETYKELSGPQKKMIVLDTIKKLINENYNEVYSESTAMSQEYEKQKQILLIIVEQTGPYIIDNLVLAINGKFKLSESRFTIWMNKLFGMCKKSKVDK